MASTWGDAWAASWGSSWGIPVVVVPPVDVDDSDDLGVGFAQVAIDAVFALFGKGATYYPPPDAFTGSVTCRVIFDAQDLDVGGFGGKTFAQGRRIELRKSEVASPAKGGSITVTATGESLKILSEPKTEDPDRLVYSFTVG